ncbi:RICIN domain-containing protein [Bradyrhizobium sp. Pear76]|uniref:RICIN domain-containing protein n=1 Tax=Bradyrhizobium oropedii TaxID=1571201 RepID=UPI001E2DA8D0|nr:RICIN domain-containing protein [Bradyrhizobium oropedii]MCC8966971.1 RICIN domain-containing protein [Bradyrhizobium oropedii]
MADAIRMDLRDLGAEAWLLWQPDWEVIGFDAHGGPPLLKKQYYVLAQYSRFVRPGFQIVSAGGASNTLAAYSPASKRLVLVTTSWEAGEDDLDLTAFAGLPATVTAYRTTSDAQTNLREERIALSSERHIVNASPARSITTYVVDGVTARSDVPVDKIQGVHKLVSQATRLCLNVAANATSSGTAIIPFSCGAYSNEEFNVVDRGGGFYSIHTVNALAGLCLNISNGTTSPGDGRTRGGPGNLIQWSCGDGRLPENEFSGSRPRRPAPTASR